MPNSTPHIPVLLDPVLDLLRVRDLPAGYFVDGTLGAGGHSFAILNAAPDSRLLGLDRDPHALELARAHLAPFAERATLVHASYEQMDYWIPRWLPEVSRADTMHEALTQDDRLPTVVGYEGDFPRLIKKDSPGVDGILLDLGISSMQVDDPARGFAFMQDGPLDMRFDPSSGDTTADDIVNTWPADEIADILYRWGEEHNSRPIARALVAARPITTTRQLAEVVAKAQRGPRQKIHPATRTFQALRIAVNDELGAVERVLPLAISCLKPGGRLAVISFHSLEDRIVKQTFKLESTDCICPPKQPICTCDHHARVELVTRKPIEADESEIAQNPRSRSAKLRVVEKI